MQKKKPTVSEMKTVEQKAFFKKERLVLCTNFRKVGVVCEHETRKVLP